MTKQIPNKNNKKHVRTLTILLAITLCIIGLYYLSINRTFDESLFDSDNVMTHIETLTGSEFNGKYAGSDGNTQALQYIENAFTKYGIQPGGENDSFYQPFRVVMPQIDTTPTFVQRDENDTVIRSFELYKDYNAITLMNGSGIDFEGEILMVGTRLNKIDPELIDGRVVVIDANMLTAEKVNFVKQNGGAGIFCCSDNLGIPQPRYYETMKMISVSGRTENPLLVGFLSRETYHYLIDALGDNLIELQGQPTGIIPHIYLDIAIDFPVVNTANIIGRIDGRNNNGEVLIISADIDGLGARTQDSYFEGAIHDTSGTALLIETARVCASQDKLPFETIVFIGWNGQYQDLAGTTYYLAHPLYPIEKTTVIHLDGLGEETREGLKVSSDNVVSSILRNNIANYGEDAGAVLSEVGPYYNAATRFADYNVPAVLFWDVNKQIQNHTDVFEEVDQSTIENAGNTLMAYLKRSVYKDVSIDYLEPKDLVIIGVFALGLLFVFLTRRLYQGDPNMKIGRRTSEQVFYSKPVTLIRKLYAFILPIIAAMFLIIILANVNSDADIKIFSGHVMSNFSSFLTIKKSILYFKELFSFDFSAIKSSNPTQNIFIVMFDSSYRSIAILSASLLLSTVIGIARGMYDGYHTKRKTRRSFGTMVMFSVPDVLVVLLGLLLYVIIAQKAPGLKNALPLKEFILPLITLSIIPTIYIARISFIAIQEEQKKDYIRNAKAKGNSKLKIYLNELLPPILFKVIDSMPTIMTMLLSNMIIVEYLFNYRGIVYYLLYFYNRADADKFVALALLLGAIYIVFTKGIQMIAKRINPLKREVKS